MNLVIHPGLERPHVNEVQEEHNISVIAMFNLFVVSIKWWELYPVNERVGMGRILW